MTIHADSLWYVRAGTGEPVGPVTAALLVSGIRAGRVPISSLVCPVGANEWAPLVAHDAFAHAVREVAPPPPAAVAAVPPSQFYVTAPAAPAGVPPRSGDWSFWKGAGVLLAVVFVGILIVRALINNSRIDHANEIAAQKRSTTRNVSTRTTFAGGGGCTALRACCDEMDRTLGHAPRSDDECRSWTRPSASGANGGECGYGTDCFCDRMLDVARTKYGMCH